MEPHSLEILPLNAGSASNLLDQQSHQEIRGTGGKSARG